MKDDFVTIRSLSLSLPAERQLRAVGWWQPDPQPHRFVSERGRSVPVVPL